MSRFFKKTIVFVIALGFFAATAAYAEEPTVKTKLQETKESIGELVEAKDENSPFDISLRIKTFKKVVDLALTEAKDLKINLIALEIENEELKAWREGMIEELNGIIKNYEGEVARVGENEDSFTLEEIQETAADFKAWREENYIPIQNQVHSLLLIEKENKAIQISNRRVVKIENDLETLEKAGFKELEKVTTMFKEAESTVKEAENENKRALDLFIGKYAVAPEETDGETATSTPPSGTSAATSTEETAETASTTPMIAPEEESASSTEEILKQSTSTSETTDSAEAKQEESIRGLISSSWKKIKGAYQIFIEMSDFVRKSLQ